MFHTNFSNPVFSLKNDHKNEGASPRATDTFFLFHVRFWSTVWSSALAGQHAGADPAVFRVSVELPLPRPWWLQGQNPPAAGGKTTTKQTAPCKARKNDLFCLDPQEEETFPQPKTDYSVPARCWLALWGLGQPWHPQDLPCPPGCWTCPAAPLAHPGARNSATTARKFVEGAAFPSKRTFTALPGTRLPV